jgi:NAD(P)H dehydrogenase (quinone)
MSTIAVTGASGHLGRRVAQLLLERGERPVLLTRDPASLNDLAARGAVVRRGDFSDSAGMQEALTGVDRLLLISIDITGPQRVALHAQAVEAARAAGVKHVIYTSLPRPDAENPAGVAPDHRATELALRASGLDWTFLRNNIYADFQVPTAAQAAATGQLVTNTGDGATAFVTRDDCAAVAAAVLASEGHAGATYDVTGPEAIDAVALAALTAEITGKPIVVVHVDDSVYAAGLVEHAGLPTEAAALYTSFGASAREGWASEVTTVVADLTGTPPTPLRDVLQAGLGADAGAGAGAS